jgi:cytochrome c oxidase cbb3-type subunit 3
MSSGWSWYVDALVALNIIGCTALLWWTSRGGKGHLDKGSSDEAGTGHVWDGDLREYDKPLPRWWINLFYLTILFGIGYLVWFPGMGRYTGAGKWTSVGQHNADRAASDAKLAATFKPYDGKAIDVLARDPQAVALGRALFSNHCATCHGSSAQGAIGYPNLTDQIWQWGGTPDNILQTVLHGRIAQMPAWETTLTGMGGETAVDDVLTYVLSLTDPSLVATGGTAVARGRKLFASVCTACHGPEGKGNAQLGAPDLTDDYWMYGRSRIAVREGLHLGRNGQMPAHLPILGETRSRLAAAYVWSLSHAPGTGP